MDNGNSVMWNKLPPGSPPAPTNLSSFLTNILVLIGREWKTDVPGGVLFLEA